MSFSNMISTSILTLPLLINGPAAAAPPNWAVTGYTARLSADGIEDVLGFSADYEDDYQLAAIALSKRIDDPYESIDLEWEAQLAKHTEGQSHWEANGLIIGRWLPFPWDNTLDTSFAVGAGLSYASELPEFEQVNHPNANQLLAYLLVELEFTVPQQQDWSLVFRVHHRSGAYGLFSDVEGASNALGIGLKYRFD
ncbi:hypothetical protein [Marinobacterium jannaschii]|uniref:hypothetical protein n=1 Tax=Marinobacterium jannaschii TaxID=64970 RepID=UPI0006860650|nr:hypothetical protein [Marinobacterium jannaschii]